MIFPTIRTLQRLAKFAATHAVLAAVAHEQPLWTSCPRAGLLGGKEARYMEDEMPFGELALVCPDGQIVHPLDWQSERPVPLLKNVQRLTAPNPGVMTGPGTNSYLVGDPATGFIAIDPGPADAEHLEKLWRAAGGDIRMIVCTHSHPDHSPAPRRCRRMCVQRRAAPSRPFWACPRPPPRAWPASSRPTGRYKIMSCWRFGQAPEGKITHTLQVVHTPGHAANHLCLLLQEDGLLFSGDHILNGSTTVIDPPDGNMADYLDSLDRLDALCAEHDVEFILPAHGYVLGEARAAIAQLKAHRLAREAKVLAAMQALPDGSMEDWVRTPTTTCPRACGRWPSARCWRMWSASARSGITLLKKHLMRQQLCTPLESRASGLVVYTQDWRIGRKLTEDMGVIEQEFTVEVQGDVSNEALQRLNQPPRSDGRPLPPVKVSIGSTGDGVTRLRVAVKGIHPGLVAHLCDQAGLQIVGMKRIRIGRLPLSTLQPGQWRLLMPYERF
jgi:glyoxylase-like metal-dependent hydrolase (beta-lactamase superfamily II)